MTPKQPLRQFAGHTKECLATWSLTKARIQLTAIIQ